MQLEPSLYGQFTDFVITAHFQFLVLSKRLKLKGASDSNINPGLSMFSSDNVVALLAIDTSACVVQ